MLRSKLEKSFGFVLVVFGLVALGGCTKKVLIKYDQQANCYTFQQAPDSSSTTSAGLNGLFMLYKITSISNSAESEGSFFFKPDELRAKEGQNITSSLTSWSGVYYGKAPETTVKKGTTVTGVGRIFLRMSPVNPNSDKFKTVELEYDSSKNETVTVIPDGAQSPAFHAPCTYNNVQQLP